MNRDAMRSLALILGGAAARPARRGPARHARACADREGEEGNLPVRCGGSKAQRRETKGFHREMHGERARAGQRQKEEGRKEEMSRAPISARPVPAGTSSHPGEHARDRGPQERHILRDQHQPERDQRQPDDRENADHADQNEQDRRRHAHQARRRFAQPSHELRQTARQPRRQALDLPVEIGALVAQMGRLPRLFLLAASLSPRRATMLKWLVPG